MEAWRILATVLLAVPGLVGVAIVMALARDRTGRPGTVTVAGLVSFTALAVACVLTLTVLPVPATWALAGGVALMVSVAALVS
ncbi:hypothetical protein [Saccharomonospora halophila]|uniref:hypothetical protein n=1 Tax=Saccharomonospora halophila TaxID=129922 RepID=UPI0003692576|nr:hypothetical protein [Saccharomonospora halophila]